MERYIKMICRLSCRPQRGFSLVELSVVLVVVGLLLGMAYTGVSKRVEVDLRAKSRQLIQELNQSIVGFALQHYRLPCPDQNGNGLEQCGTIAGEFPWKTVGLTFKPVGATDIPLRYGAYQNIAANLVQASNVFSPILPTQNASSPPVAVITPNNVNGLDFCRKIRDASVIAPNAADLNAGGRNIAYAILDAGVADADGNGSVWDGANAALGASIELPGRVVSQTYDDFVYAVPFYQLLGDMGCSALGKVHAMGVAAVAAKDTYDLWNLMVAARTLDRTTAESGLASAITGESFATFDVAMSAASVALSLGCAADSLGACAVAIPVAAAGAVGAAAALVVATAAVVQAGTGLTNATAALAATIAQKNAAAVYANNTIAKALALDLQGIAR